MQMYKGCLMKRICVPLNYNGKRISASYTPERQAKSYFWNIFELNAESTNFFGSSNMTIHSEENFHVKNKFIVGRSSLPRNVIQSMILIEFFIFR